MTTHKCEPKVANIEGTASSMYEGTVNRCREQKNGINREKKNGTNPNADGQARSSTPMLRPYKRRTFASSSYTLMHLYKTYD